MESETQPTTETMPKSHNPQVPWQQEAVILHSQLLLHSFQHWTGHALIDTSAPPILVAQRLFEASFVLVSHGTEPEPIFNYGNRKALDLWQLDWEAFTNLPSRCSAEPVEQKERERMLASAKNQGFISNYRGIRISSTGERFKIEGGIIWNVLNSEQRPCGQAATLIAGHLSLDNSDVIATPRTHVRAQFQDLRLCTTTLNSVCCKARSHTAQARSY